MKKLVLIGLLLISGCAYPGRYSVGYSTNVSYPNGYYDGYYSRGYYNQPQYVQPYYQPPRYQYIPPVPSFNLTIPFGGYHPNYPRNEYWEHERGEHHGWGHRRDND